MKYGKMFGQHLFVLLMISQFYSCLTAGTHGAIRVYNYPVNLDVLQKAVDNVILESNDIFRDSSRNYIIDITNHSNDTVDNNLYNDGRNYITILLKPNASGEEVYTYTLHFPSGNNLDTVASSFSIVYAYDEKGNGGSENDGFPWQTPFLKKRLISQFEGKFINRIEKKLGRKHT